MISRLYMVEYNFTPQQSSRTDRFEKYERFTSSRRPHYPHSIRVFSRYYQRKYARTDLASHYLDSLRLNNLISLHFERWILDNKSPDIVA